MKNLSKFFLILSVMSFAACTTLTGAEKCALIGQFQEGTQIGTQARVSSVGSTVYSYNTPSYNPICKIPTTDEEAALVTDLIPVAKEKQKKRTREYGIYYAGLMGVLILLLLSVPSRYNP